MDDLKQILPVFLEETSDGLLALQENIRSLHGEKQDNSVVESSLRILHNINANSGFFQFRHLDALSKGMDALFRLSKNYGLRLEADVLSALEHGRLKIKEGISLIYNSADDSGLDVVTVLSEMSRICKDYSSRTVELSEDALDLLPDFLSEALELIYSFSDSLTALEENLNDQEEINKAFRAIHTIKGGAGFLELDALVELTHSAEDLLSLLRSGKLKMSEQKRSLLLRTSDQILGFLEELSLNKRSPSRRFPELTEELQLAMLLEADSPKPPKQKPPRKEDDLNNILPIFLSESRNGLKLIRRCLDRISEDEEPELRPALVSLQNIVANAGFFHFDVLKSLASELLSCLQNMKNPRESTSLFIECLDFLQNAFDFISTHGDDRQLDCDELLVRLKPSMVKKTAPEPLTEDALELLPDFLAETEDLIFSLGDSLLRLESDPSDLESLNTIFRAVHTIKGGAGFLELKQMVRITHAAEDLLSKMRSRKLAVSSRRISALYSLSDLLQKSIQSLRKDNLFLFDGYDELEGVFQNLLEADLDVVLPPPELPTTLEESSSPTFEIFRPVKHRISDENPSLLKEFLVEANEHLQVFNKNMTLIESDSDVDGAVSDAFRAVHTIRAGANILGLKTLGNLALAGEEILSSIQNSQTDLSSDRIGSLLALGDGISSLLNNLREQGTEYAADPHLDKRLKGLQSDLNVQKAGPKKISSDPNSSLSPENTLRVKVSQLDALMRLVGELVLARNQLQQLSENVPELGLDTLSRNVNQLTGDLQRQVIQTRLQPVSFAFRKIPRIVREVGLQTGKELLLQVEGEDTELDKRVLEQIQDPLMHLIRNAIDHGIEAPEQRSLLGKNPKGLIRVSARQENGQVVLKVSDDGSGLDQNRIRQKALEQGLIHEEELDSLTDEHVLALIFLPGFSTREEVTNISGRGVGMDVIKRSIDGLGGSVSVHSELGKGTEFELHIPLTLAIVPALIVQSGVHRLVIPQMQVLELSGKPPEAIRSLSAVNFYSFRGEPLPWVSLRTVLGMEFDPKGVMVICEHQKNRFAILVDYVYELRDIVVQPAPSALSGLQIFSGLTLLDDGKPSLILDTPSVASIHQLLGHKTVRRAEVQPKTAAANSFVAFHLERHRFVLPLDYVQRIASVSAGDIGADGILNMAHLRGMELPVLRFSDKSKKEADPYSRVQLLICEVNDRALAVSTDKVIDVIHADASDFDSSATEEIQYLRHLGEQYQLVDLPAEMAASPHFMELSG